MPTFIEELHSDVRLTPVELRVLRAAGVRSAEEVLSLLGTFPSLALKGGVRSAYITGSQAMANVSSAFSGVVTAPPREPALGAMPPPGLALAAPAVPPPPAPPVAACCRARCRIDGRVNRSAAAIGHAVRCRLAGSGSGTTGHLRSLRRDRLRGAAAQRGRTAKSRFLGAVSLLPDQDRERRSQ